MGSGAGAAVDLAETAGAADAAGMSPLLWLARLGYAVRGALALSVLGLGLVAFGVFSVLCARWASVHIPPGRQHESDGRG